MRWKMNGKCRLSTMACWRGLFLAAGSFGTASVNVAAYSRIQIAWVHQSDADGRGDMGPLGCPVAKAPYPAHPNTPTGERKDHQNPKTINPQPPTLPQEPQPQPSPSPQP